MAPDFSTAVTAIVIIGLSAAGVAAVTAKMAETDFAITLLVVLVGFFFLVEKKKLRTWEKLREQAVEVSAVISEGRREHKTASRPLR